MQPHVTRSSARRLPRGWCAAFVVAGLWGCVKDNPAFEGNRGSEDELGDSGDGDGEPGDGDAEPGDGDGDGDGDGEPGDGDGDGDGEPGDGDGEPDCAPLIDCFGACVDLDSDPSHCGGCGTPCLGVCEGGTCDDSAQRLIFLSSQPLKGTMGGLEGADAWCTELASAAGLEGDFKAWLSTAQLGPAARMVHFPGPYRLLDGTLIADGWADLTDGTLAHPIDLDETGLMIPPAQWICEGHEVWTNTKADGTPRTTSDCGGWQTLEGTSAVGRYTADDHGWTEAACMSVTCGAELPIYCVQQ
jgi:hypothetical protein